MRDYSWLRRRSVDACCCCGPEDAALPHWLSCEHHNLSLSPRLPCTNFTGLLIFLKNSIWPRLSFAFEARHSLRVKARNKTETAQSSAVSRADHAGAWHLAVLFFLKKSLGRPVAAPELFCLRAPTAIADAASTPPSYSLPGNACARTDRAADCRTGSWTSATDENSSPPEQAAPTEP